MATPPRRPIIVGNWKMNLGGSQALEHAQHLLTLVQLTPETPELVLLPPFTALAILRDLSPDPSGGLRLGAQDLSPHEDGAFTGDISGSMLTTLGCRYVLAGHSERRQHHGEADATVNAKVKAALRHELTPLLCVGEDLHVRQEGRHLSHTLAQVDAGLKGVEPDHIQDLLIAYEPIWAIGTGHVATPEDAQEVCAAIRGRLADCYGPATSQQTRILYGGSVKANTSAVITNQPDIDGALVGGASLDPSELAGIWQSAHQPADAAHLMQRPVSPQDSAEPNPPEGHLS